MPGPDPMPMLRRQASPRPRPPRNRRHPSLLLHQALLDPLHPRPRGHPGEAHRPLPVHRSGSRWRPPPSTHPRRMVAGTCPTGIRWSSRSPMRSCPPSRGWRRPSTRTVDSSRSTSRGAVFALDNTPTLERAEKHRAVVEAALAAHFGRPVPLILIEQADAHEYERHGRRRWIADDDRASASRGPGGHARRAGADGPGRGRDRR